MNIQKFNTENKTLEKICVGDQIDIIAHGRGLKLLDFPEIELKKIDPNLLKSMNLNVINNKLTSMWLLTLKLWVLEQN